MTVFPKQRKAKALERVIFNGPVRAQSAPFFEVKSKGTTVEWTDKRLEAHAAFQQAGTPKQMFRIDVAGMRAVKVLVEAA